VPHERFLVGARVRIREMRTHSYAVERLARAGMPVIALRDQTSHDEALVAPAAGNNCFQWLVHFGERRIDLLAVPTDDATLKQGGSSFGIPILFPFPNRVKDAHYRFQDKESTLDANSSGNHIHGVVLRRPWRVEAMKASSEVGAWVRSGIRSEDHPDIQRQFPFPFDLSVTHTLKAGTLRIEAVVENTGAGDMPMGFGLHPWFPAPLIPDGKREAVEVQIPARRVWELNDMIPTGRTLPADGKFDLRRPTALDNREYDDVLTDIERTADGSACLMRDPSVPLDILIHADAGFREWVLYAPLKRATVCLEPYTCTTNAINLQPQGIDAGLLTLKPGERWTGIVTISTRLRG
jgi:aldose 1-epimerase